MILIIHKYIAVVRTFMALSGVLIYTICFHSCCPRCPCLVAATACRSCGPWCSTADWGRSCWSCWCWSSHWYSRWSSPPRCHALPRSVNHCQVHLGLLSRWSRQFFACFSGWAWWRPSAHWASCGSVRPSVATSRTMAARVFAEHPG